MQIYGDSLSRINSLLGKDFSVVTSVTLLNDQSVARARVNVSYLLASFLTIARFDDSNRKLWAVLERLKVINTLFPTAATDPELGMTAALTKLTEVDGARQAEGII